MLLAQKKSSARIYTNLLLSPKLPKNNQTKNNILLLAFQIY